MASASVQSWAAARRCGRKSRAEKSDRSAIGFSGAENAMASASWRHAARRASRDEGRRRPSRPKERRSTSKPMTGLPAQGGSWKHEHGRSPSPAGGQTQRGEAQDDGHGEEAPRHTLGKVEPAEVSRRASQAWFPRSRSHHHGSSHVSVARRDVHQRNGDADNEIPSAHRLLGHWTRQRSVRCAVTGWSGPASVPAHTS